MKRTMLAGLLAGLTSAASAGAATLYVGHGIDGRDLGQPTSDLPVDVCLVTNGSVAPLLKDVLFKQFAKLPDLPAGRYDVQVRLALPGDAGCDGPVAIAASVFLGFGENATAFAHLTEYGTPTITKFVNDLRRLGPEQTRLYARHAAAFGDVNVFLRAGSRSAFIQVLENPEQEGADLRAGSWFVTIYAPKSWRAPAFQAPLQLEAGKAYFAYAIGTPANQTFDVVIQRLDVP